MDIILDRVEEALDDSEAREPDLALTVVTSSSLLADDDEEPPPPPPELEPDPEVSRRRTVAAGTAPTRHCAGDSAYLSAHFCKTYILRIQMLQSTLIVSFYPRLKQTLPEFYSGIQWLVVQVVSICLTYPSLT